MKEYWKPIPGYEERYEISNLGQVRSVGRYISYTCNNKIYVRWLASKIRKLSCGAGKVPRITLYDGSNCCIYPVCKLVASVWVPNPNSYECVIHKDKNPFNNTANNLIWAPYTQINLSCDKEEWRPVFNYEGIYEVSNTGKVRSVSRNVSRNRKRNSKDILDNPAYTSKELKPYSVSRSGNVKYHLHRRTHSGYYGQSDEYIYAEELVRLAFPELYNLLF